MNLSWPFKFGMSQVPLKPFCKTPTSVEHRLNLWSLEQVLFTSDRHRHIYTVMAQDLRTHHEDADYSAYKYMSVGISLKPVMTRLADGTDLSLLRFFTARCV